MPDAEEYEVPDGFPWTIVLGIDPGTLVMGYGALVLRPGGPVLLASGALRAPRVRDVPRRLGHLRQGLDSLLRRLKPDVVVVEEAFASANVASALRVGEGRGVVLSAAVCSGVCGTVVQYPPAVVKKSLVGNGQADKTQVAKCVAVELGLEEPPRPLDATDALALALCYVHKSRLAATLSGEGRGSARRGPVA